MLLAGTSDGVHVLEEGRTLDLGGAVTALASGGGFWAVTGAHRVSYSSDGIDWKAIATLPDLEIRCLLPSGDEALAGTSEAHLYRVRSSAAERIEAFEQVEGRDGWYTPWGGPPDTRSLAVADDGAIYANVHVGGIPKTTDGGLRWAPTIHVDADVHQVLAHDTLVLAACAPGLAVSSDAGNTWRMDAGGLHGHYCRAVAVGDDTLLVSASTGPFTKQAAVYHRALGSDGRFEKCAGGLPEWFGSNIDTHCLVADGERVAIGTHDGEIWLSEDRGTSWDLAAKGLEGISSLVFATFDR